MKKFLNVMTTTLFFVILLGSIVCFCDLDSMGMEADYGTYVVAVLSAFGILVGGLGVMTSLFAWEEDVVEC